MLLVKALDTQNLAHLHHHVRVIYNFFKYPIPSFSSDFLSSKYCFFQQSQMNFFLNKTNN